MADAAAAAGEAGQARAGKVIVSKSPFVGQPNQPMVTDIFKRKKISNH
jgi:hypothetical protein